MLLQEGHYWDEQEACKLQTQKCITILFVPLLVRTSPWPFSIDLMSV